MRTIIFLLNCLIFLLAYTTFSVAAIFLFLSIAFGYIGKKIKIHAENTQLISTQLISTWTKKEGDKFSNP